MFDLLWSDPSEIPGRGPSGRGVDCIAFGPDVTEEFLRLNKLDVCIRSHQVIKAVQTEWYCVCCVCVCVYVMSVEPWSLF